MVLLRLWIALSSSVLISPIDPIRKIETDRIELRHIIRLKNEEGL
jgi:hypothetical protein